MRRTKVYVDGRKMRASYNASMGVMKARLPALKPGKHTVKITATDASLAAAAASRLMVE